MAVPDNMRQIPSPVGRPPVDPTSRNQQGMTTSESGSSVAKRPARIGVLSSHITIPLELPSTEIVSMARANWRIRDCGRAVHPYGSSEYKAQK